jgi:hypothetical protein
VLWKGCTYLQKNLSRNRIACFPYPTSAPVETPNAFSAFQYRKGLPLQTLLLLLVRSRHSKTASPTARERPCFSFFALWEGIAASPAVFRADSRNPHRESNLCSQAVNPSHSSAFCAGGPLSNVSRNNTQSCGRAAQDKRSIAPLRCFAFGSFLCDSTCGSAMFSPIGFRDLPFH